MRTPGGPDVWEALRREIDRSRRHEHTATLMRLPAVAQGDRRARRELAATVDRLRAILRTMDAVWVHRDAVYVLLPETNRDAVEALVARLRRVSPGLVPADGLGIACFPDDGLTANALRQAVDVAAQGAPQRGALRFRKATATAFESVTEAERP